MKIGYVRVWSEFANRGVCRLTNKLPYEEANGSTTFVFLCEESFLIAAFNSPNVDMQFPQSHACALTMSYPC